MAKNFKPRLYLPSFHLCCSERPSSFPKSPLPAVTYLFSPVNPKAFNISYPSFPDPPPSTPVHPISKQQVTYNIIPVHSQCPSKPFPRNTISHSNAKKMHNAPLSYNSSRQIPPPKLKNKEEKTRRNNSKGTTQVSISSQIVTGSAVKVMNKVKRLKAYFGLLAWILHMTGYPLETKDENSINGSRRKKSTKFRRLKRYLWLWSTCKGGEETKRGMWAPECKAPAKKPVFWQVLPGMVEGKVNESYAVVKRSDDPYEDFKGSMLEMILEKLIFADKDLEQLLQCFLSLNSRHHHQVICESPRVRPPPASPKSGRSGALVGPTVHSFPFACVCVSLYPVLDAGNIRFSRVASTFYEKTDKRWCVKENAIDKPILYTFVCETMILESSETILRIGKVLGTRSALTVSK